jgi:hypothetical protein
VKKQLLVFGLVGALLIGALSPALAGSVSAAPAVQSHTQAHPALFDKTRFVIHLGLAYFAFHHFVYNPYKAGSFKSGASHRTVSILKAGAALLVTYHELKVAYDIAKGSSSGVLRTLSKPMTGLIATANRVANKLKGGQYNDAEVKSTIDSANAFSRQATHNGISIKDCPKFDSRRVRLWRTISGAVLVFVGHPGSAKVARDRTHRPCCPFRRLTRCSPGYHER